MEVIHTNLSIHWMFHAYSLCTVTCLEVQMKGLVVSVFFSSVPGEHLAWHKKLTSAHWVLIGYHKKFLNKNKGVQFL